MEIRRLEGMTVRRQRPGVVDSILIGRRQVTEVSAAVARRWSAAGYDAAPVEFESDSI